ncbi:uncharacterized protein UTRI_06194 [Ustilago trichophora]|uniref:Effector family protein Eff1 n=1 Tax=Ustilago trichophora TaxID=86804 RepID=A0A5C3EGP6_9BASI|nr:uncharacterized protein UTRI_06194 [Ustilago trichophora]
MLKLWLLSILFLVVATGQTARDPAPEGFGPELANSFADAHRVHSLATEMETILDFPSGHLRPAYRYSPQAHSRTVARHLASPTTRIFEVHDGGRGQVPVYAFPVYESRQGQRPNLGLMFFNMERMGDERVTTPTFLTGLQPGFLHHLEMNPWQYLDERATLTLRDLRHRLGPIHTNLV